MRALGFCKGPTIPLAMVPDDIGSSLGGLLVHLSIYLPIYRSICPSIYVSIYLSVDFVYVAAPPEYWVRSTATRLVTESGCLATNPSHDKPIEDWQCSTQRPATKVCIKGGLATATNGCFGRLPCGSQEAAPARRRGSTPGRLRPEVTGCCWLALPRPNGPVQKVDPP